MLARRHLELILYKTYADLRNESAKTYIGFLWWVFDPLFFMVIFYVVFGLLQHRDTEGYVDFLLTGLVAWRWFQNTVMHGANAILDNKALMRQVYLPKAVFPLVTILMDFTKFTFVFVLLLIFLWLTGESVGSAYLALPFLILAQFGLIVAVTCLVSALVPFFPDLKIFLEHLLQLAFFLSGIFFDGSRIPEQYQFYFYLNPMANLIDGYRAILLHDRLPDLSALVVIAALSALGILYAYRLLMRYDHTYPKIVR